MEVAAGTGCGALHVHDNTTLAKALPVPRTQETGWAQGGLAEGGGFHQ